MRRVLAILLVALTGCAVAPRGPVVSHTVTYRFTGRPDHLTTIQEEWSDKAFSRGVYLFTDPNLQMICAWHTNQTALGGGSRFMAGSAGIMVDSNVVPFVSATGTAVGNVVGAAVKTAVK